MKNIDYAERSNADANDGGLNYKVYEETLPSSSPKDATEQLIEEANKISNSSSSELPKQNEIDEIVNDIYKILALPYWILTVA